MFRSLVFVLVAFTLSSCMKSATTVSPTSIIVAAEAPIGIYSMEQVVESVHTSLKKICSGNVVSLLAMDKPGGTNDEEATNDSTPTDVEKVQAQADLDKASTLVKGFVNILPKHTYRWSGKCK